MGAEQQWHPLVAALAPPPAYAPPGDQTRKCPGLEPVTFQCTGRAGPEPPGWAAALLALTGCGHGPAVEDKGSGMEGPGCCFL